MISRFYYTLDELTGNNYDSFVLASNVGFYQICSYLLGKDPAIASDDAYTKKLMYHIWLNLSQKYLLCLDVEHPRWENVERKPYDGFGPDEMYEVHCLGQNMLSIFEDTKERYLTLIQMYEDELDDLLDGVVTVTDGDGTVRFNDTPQNTPTAGGYAEDNYSTNVTTNKNTVTVTSDLNTKMARIDEIYRLLKNLYADWAFEFNKLIVGE